MLGLSDALLADHLALYKDYVDRLNELDGLLAATVTDAALKHRGGYLLNAVLLHEQYFEQFVPGGLTLSGAKAIAGRELEALKTDLWEAGLASTGWVLLVFWPGEKVARTVVVSEHHVGVPAASRILLAMDCWEHAYARDYGVRKADYLQAFMSNLDWNIIAMRGV
jgi:Fe-Mn family superoxide dismutase